MQAFIGTGFNLVLSFNPLPGFDPRFRQMDFEKEPGRVRKTERKTDDISPIIILRAPVRLLPLLHSSSIPSPLSDISYSFCTLFFHISSLSAPFSGSPFSPVLLETDGAEKAVSAWALGVSATSIELVTGQIASLLRELSILSLDFP